MDMLALKELDISGQGIRSLKGLEEAINLDRLQAQDNRLTEIRPLMENVSMGGFQRGARIDVRDNDLDLSEGSPALRDVTTLLERGVLVRFGPTPGATGNADGPPPRP
jgi:Leucine-rich repeat (LRR) protein